MLRSLAHNRIEVVMTWMKMLRLDVKAYAVFDQVYLFSWKRTKAPHRTLNTSNCVCRFAFIRITRFKNLQRLHYIHTHVLMGSYVYAKSLNWLLLLTFYVILRVVVYWYHQHASCVSDFCFSKTIFFQMTCVINDYSALTICQLTDEWFPFFFWKTWFIPIRHVHLYHNGIAICFGLIVRQVIVFIRYFLQQQKKKKLLKPNPSMG